MAKGRGKQKIDRQAVAKANGYVRGANREKDQTRNDSDYAAGSMVLQDWVLNEYSIWISDDDGISKEQCLQEGQPIPDLATVKDFIRYYIYSTTGMITLRPTMSSVTNFAERFFGGFKRVTKSSFDQKDTQDVYKWISKSLVKEEVIENKTRPKHMFTHCDLTNILVSIWTDDDPFFIHERNRVQMTLAILLYCYSGARIGAFIPDTSKADERGLRYEDIELYIYRRPDGEKEIFFRLSEKWVKNNYDPKNTVFRVAMREHGKLRFNPVPYLLALAFADGAFFDMDSPKDLEGWDPDNSEPIRLLWRPHIVNEPIIRTVTRFAGASGRALTRDTFCRLFRNIADNAGYCEIITIHSLRRGLANKIDKVATEAERSQLLTQKDPNVYGRSYLDNTSALSSMDVFLGETMRLDHIEYLQGVGKYREKGYPRCLPSEREHAVQNDPMLQKLQYDVQNLVKNKDSDPFETSITKKREKALRNKLRTKALKSYREEWVQNRLEGKIISRGKSVPSGVIANDIAACLFKVMPERQHLAEMIPSDKLLSHQEMLFAVNDLLTLCVRDYDVLYRPGETPTDGKCPFGDCHFKLEKLSRSRRSNHIQDCQRKELCYTPSRKVCKMQYCYECFKFYSVNEWENHCGVHLANISRRCEMVTYCHTLIRPGYCPFCLGDQNQESSKRMRYWKRSNELRAHIEEHLKTLQEYSCTHPMCQEQFQDEMGLRYHLADIHGLQKAIWDRREQPVTLSGQSPEIQLDEHFKRNGRKRTSNQTESEHLEPGQQPKKARVSSPSSQSTGQLQDLHVVQWKPPNPVTCYSNPKEDSSHTMRGFAASEEPMPKCLRSSTIDDDHADSLPSLTFCESPNNSEMSMSGLIDPQLLEYDLSSN